MPVNRRIIKALPDVVGTTVQAVSIPVGTVIGWDSDDPIPTGFIDANGATFDPIRYPALAAVYEDNKTPARSDNPRFASTAERDSLMPSPLVGQTCVTTDTATEWIRTNSGWRANGGVLPGGHLYRSSAFSIPNATWTTIPWNVTAFSNLITVVANGFTIVQPGLYLLAAQIWFGGGLGGVWRVAKIINNATSFSWAQAQVPPSNQGPMFSMTAVVAMSGGETITMSIYQDSGAAMNLLPSSAAPEIGSSFYVQCLCGT